MALSRIKGITIEIGGDTSKLDKALANVNKTIKTSQSELKDLNKLLKLDPGNTELLQQKYKALTKEIDATKEKLKTLKTAQDQAKKALAEGKMGQEQYDALQREIVETEQKLKSLTKEFKNFGSVAAQQVANAGKKLETVGNGMANVGQKMMPATVALTALGTEAVKTAADFEASMSKVASISGASAEEMEALTAKAREMGKQTKYSASESADAFRYMAMAGWKAEDMLEGIEGIMYLAGASGTDLATTSDIVTDGLTAFGLSAKDTQHFVDVLAKVSANANTNVELLGESFKYVAPVAGSMGYSIDDVSVALGLMANSGIKASNAGTALRSLMTRMAKPTKESAMAMEELGIALDDGQGNMLPFMDIMKQIRAGMGDLKISEAELNAEMQNLQNQLDDGTLSQEEYEEAMMDLTTMAYGAEGAMKAEAAAMLSGKTGMAGLLAIVNASDEDFEKLTASIQNSTGASKEMYDVMTNNLEGKLAILKSSLQELAISMGNILIPYVEKVVKKLQQFSDWLNSLSDDQKEMVVKIGALVAALGPLLIVTGKLTAGLGQIMQFAPKIVGTLGTATGPILAVAAAVAVLVAAFKHLWDTNEEFRNDISSSWAQISEAFNGFFQGITDRINEFGFDFENFGEVMSAVWDKFCNYIGPLFTMTFESLADTIDGVFTLILGLWDTFKAIFDGDWSKAWDSWEKTVWHVCDLSEKYYKKLLDTIDKLTGGKITNIKNKIQNTLDWIKSAFENLKLKIGSIELPHFSIEGGFSFNPPSIPKIKVDWYAKAMDKGMILNSPTIFGAAGGKLLGAGEAGSEAVVGTNSLANMIQNAVGSTGIDTMVELMSEYLPYLAQNTEIRLDSGALVGATAMQMNNALGRISAREGRR